MSNTSPLISVIVPCYNQAQYLDECLQSVLDQTYQDWECIIVNDGSPDNTEEITKQWTEKDARFKYLYKENGGLSSARNAGIEMAKGKWILPLDADDKIGSRYLELAEKEFGKGFNLIYTKIQLFGCENRNLNVAPFQKERLLYQNPFYCSCIYPKSKWLKIGGYDTNLIYGMEDWEFFINMVYNTPTKVKKIDYLGFFYRRKIESMDTIVTSNQYKKTFSKEYIFKKHLQHYVQNSDEINNFFLEIDRYNKYQKKYNQLFSKNIIGKILYSIANKING